MLKNLLQEAVTTISGKQVEAIADLLNNKKYINEFLIAKKLDITINQTRNILYKLSDHGLVSSTRKKDKRKGWYTYFWKIEILKSLEFLKNIVLKNIEQINYQKKSRETKQYYICERCDIELNEENALLHNFTCNECGGIFTLKDNAKILRDLERNLGKFKEKLKLLNIEIEKENAQIEKKKLKELKKEEEEKARKRGEAAKKRAEKKKADLKNKVVAGKSKTSASSAKSVKQKKKQPVKKAVKKTEKKSGEKTAKKKIPGKSKTSASSAKSVKQKKKSSGKKIKSAKKRKK